MAEFALVLHRISYLESFIATSAANIAKLWCGKRVKCTDTHNSELFVSYLFRSQNE